MTVRDIALIILRDFGVRSLDPSSNQNNLNGRGVGTGDLEAVVFHLNGALEEIYNDGPAAISERPIGDVLRPETAVTLTATQYSRTISSYTTFASWMVGCTIRIAGDDHDNELLSQTELARPYMGTTGSGKTASIWGDAIPLPSNISHIIPPVDLVGYPSLQVVGTEEEFRERAGHSLSSSPRDVGVTQNTTYNRTIGTPTWGYVDTWHDQTTGTSYLKKFLRVAPMPATAFSTRFKVKITPPVLATTAIDTGDHTTDPGTLLPVDWMNAVFLPIARQRATSDALFVNHAGLSEIARQFSIARAILKGSNPGIGCQEGQYH